MFSFAALFVAELVNWLHCHVNQFGLVIKVSAAGPWNWVLGRWRPEANLWSMDSEVLGMLWLPACRDPIVVGQLTSSQITVETIRSREEEIEYYLDTDCRIYDEGGKYGELFREMVSTVLVGIRCRVCRSAG